MDEVIDFLEAHYKLIVGIAVPIIVAIIGIFKARSWIKKNNAIKGTNNIQQISEGNINSKDSFNTVNQNGAAVQIVGHNNQITAFDLNAIQTLAKSFQQTMYPYAERAFEKFNLNSQSFLANLNTQLEQLPSSALDKFSEADVQMALYKAMQGAGRTNSIEVHKVLSQLIADRVQKPKCSITELAINESIEIAAKLDVNLIKMLAFSFIFSRTKYTLLLDEPSLFQKLCIVANEFKELEVTTSRFEYLEAISCGKILQFTSNDLLTIISKSYPQLFIKMVTSEQLKEISLPINVQDICFIKKNNDTYLLNPHMGLYLFENAPVRVGDVPFVIEDNEVKDQLKNFLNNNRISNEEIKKRLETISSFENILNTWDNYQFSRFSLTAVGIAIGRAYLEQKNLGNYDINIWIN
ncbi:TPA: hypothetical protein JBE91_01260 [Legionella pneumophila]|nr:hypothetical protein [Legionella pneumophila]